MAKDEGTAALLIRTAERLAHRQSEMLAALPRLTVVEVAREAGVSRATAGRYPTFRERLTELQQESKLVLPSHLAEAKRRANERIAELEGEIEALAQRVRLLSLELTDLRANPNAPTRIHSIEFD